MDEDNPKVNEPKYSKLTHIPTTKPDENNSSKPSGILPYKRRLEILNERIKVMPVGRIRNY